MATVVPTPPTDLFVKYVVSEGQDIYDVTLQLFGTLEELFEIIDNNSVTLNTPLKSGTELVFNAEQKGNLLVKNAFKRTAFIVNNADEAALNETVGDYNDDYNNDYF